MPAPKSAALEVIESQLSFHVLVDALGAPAFLDQLHELDEGHALVRREVKVVWRVVVIAPLADEPDSIAPAWLAAVIGRGDDADKREARVERRSRGVLARALPA